MALGTKHSHSHPVALKGGYDVDVISRCSLAVVKVLLGEPAPMLPSMVASPEATETIYQVALVQSKHWRSLHPRALEPSEGRLTYLFALVILINCLVCRGPARRYECSRYITSTEWNRL